MNDPPFFTMDHFHESYKKFKKIKDNPEYVKKYGGGTYVESGEI